MTSNHFRARQSFALVLVLLSQMFLFPRQVEAQRIKVTVGQPSIWSLEQAHYLLAQIRERNMGIRNPLLSEEDLDPNATNATRLDALRTLFEIGVSYDQRLGLTNSLNRQNLEFNQSRRQELFSRRSSLFDQKNRNLETLGRLRSELSALEEVDSNDQERNQKKREIRSIEDQNKAVDEQLSNLSTEMDGVGGGSDQLSSPSAQGGPGPFSDGLSNRIGKTITDNFAKDAAKNPRLAATVKLDNYVQMQYELLAKQLTLLRDEVGPNQRLVFLELPTSIYAVPGRGDEWSAQSNWEVTGYYRENKFARTLNALNQRAMDLYTQLVSDVNGKSEYEKNRLRGRYRVQRRSINADIANTRRAFYEERAEALKHGGAVFSSPDDAGTGFRSVNSVSLFGAGDITDLAGLARRLHAPTGPAPTYIRTLLRATTLALLAGCGTTPTEACRDALVTDLNAIVSSGTHYSPANFGAIQLSPETALLRMRNPSGDDLVAFNCNLIEDTFPREIRRRRLKDARAIDLIPRQSSLNVTDLKEIVKERGAKLVFSFLIGIGGSVNYQQRRERFEQFQQQEVYGAGFGKGEATFGWNFSPMPGTRRLAPGIRTTYAVLVVPRDAARIQLKATARPYRTNRAPEEEAATETATFDLEVPNGPGDEGFFVSRIDYPLVAVNQRSVVVLRGDFSSQTGILINGTPLVRAVGVASPWLGSEREKPHTNVNLGDPDTSIKGFYEVINANQLIMVFLMPKDFKGTPHITLVSPGRARSINDISLNINGDPWKRLKEFNEGYMIGARAKDPETPLSIGDIEIEAERPVPVPGQNPVSIKGNVHLRVAGSKNGSLRMFFNTTQVAPTSLGGGLYQFQVDLPLNRERISFAITEGDEVDTKHYDNPAFAKFVVTQRLYEWADPEDPDDDSVTLVVEGRRITDLEVSTENAAYQWQSRSFNQGVLSISGLKESPSLVKLTDKLTGEALTPIQISRQKPKPKPRPTTSEGGGRRTQDQED